MFEKPLQGTKVTIRKFTEQDINSTYLKWLNDPVVTRYSNQRFVLHTKQSCINYFLTFENSSNIFLAIKNKKDNKVIGTLTIYHALHHQTADIGLMIGERGLWGQGYGQEAFSIVVDKLISMGSIRKITAGTMEKNRAMIRIIEQAGLRWEATRKQQELLDGEAVDILYYARYQ